MKTQIITILICILFANTTTHAQEVFPLSGAKWTEEITYMGIPQQYISYVLQGDTVIDGIQRAKLYIFYSPNSADSYLIGFFHIQGNSVFFRSLNNFAYYPICSDYYLQDGLFFDFSLLEGDSFENCTYPGMSIVSSVDSIELGGINRKSITFGINGGQWTEGIGSLDLFYGKEWIPTGFYGKHLVCFTLNDELIYLDPRYSKCPVLGNATTILETKNNQLTIFPNPAKSTVTVQSDHSLKRLQIYDISGTLLHEQSCNGELQTTIQKLPHPPGMHFVKITLQSGDVYTKKLIIQ
ncbi:MAG: T9SS type A sorting domain-containing protein [Bacteroidales bacterium]|jgi:hypothetical protein|nr:T9SS type A sorting domain-containing protein [Bacteroidales bacterium]